MLTPLAPVSAAPRGEGAAEQSRSLYLKYRYAGTYGANSVEVADPGARKHRGCMSTESTAMPQPGTPAPDFTLPDQNGNAVHLADLRGKHVVLYFYPKDDTPGCTKEACSFRDEWGELERQGVVVLGISRDDAESHQRFISKYQLPFTLLSDQDASVHHLYGAWGERTNYGKTYTGTLRTTFYIRPDGTIGHVWTHAKTEGHGKEVLDYITAHQ